MYYCIESRTNFSTVMCVFHFQRYSVGTLSYDDDNHGSENVAKKLIFVLSNLIASVWTRSICQMQATFPGVEFLRILFKFKKRKENSSSHVHVLHRTSN